MSLTPEQRKALSISNSYFECINFPDEYWSLVREQERDFRDVPQLSFKMRVLLLTTQFKLTAQTKEWMEKVGYDQELQKSYSDFFFSCFVCVSLSYQELTSELDKADILLERRNIISSHFVKLHKELDLLLVKMSPLLLQVVVEHFDVPEPRKKVLKGSPRGRILKLCRSLHTIQTTILSNSQPVEKIEKIASEVKKIDQDVVPYSLGMAVESEDVDSAWLQPWTLDQWAQWYKKNQKLLDMGLPSMIVSLHTVLRSLGRQEQKTNPRLNQYSR